MRTGKRKEDGGDKGRLRYIKMQCKRGKNVRVKSASVVSGITTKDIKASLALVGENSEMTKGKYNVISRDKMTKMRDKNNEKEMREKYVKWSEIENNTKKTKTKEDRHT